MSNILDVWKPYSSHFFPVVVDVSIWSTCLQSYEPCLRLHCLINEVTSCQGNGARGNTRYLYRENEHQKSTGPSVVDLNQRLKSCPKNYRKNMSAWYNGA
ncbi:hypothetical protein OCU04_002989 [Sclerotinia nivalis]|uniref:Uncharacterized protein n=1 Tax=Sclerotinia nivalis TaxID=352851 RepID=A0A9X0DN42_9HELO|nr:hypothetical protein OCU04_002989 [Sclerotinia nivalis]